MLYLMIWVIEKLGKVDANIDFVILASLLAKFIIKASDHIDLP